MNRPVVLICLESPHAFWRLSAEQERSLRIAFPDVEVRVATAVSLPDHLPDAQVYLGWRFESEWLAASSHLRWISSPAAGTDHLPAAEIAVAGVVFTRSYGFHGRPMAEHAMGLVLGFSRGLFLSQRLQRNRTWWKDDLAEEFFDLAGATMTIVGCGSIGGYLARTARVLGMNVIGVRRTPPSAPRDSITWIHASAVQQAVAVADVVINLLPATSATRHFFDQDLLSACKRGSLFINLGRASTVDQRALIAALDSGRLRGAALDVADPKPLPVRDPLRLHPRVLLTPKSAAFSRTYMDEAVAFFADNLRRHLAGQPLNGLAGVPLDRHSPPLVHSPLAGG
jgi:phosphoglycerate dehydrogenase-like enzyme